MAKFKSLLLKSNLELCSRKTLCKHNKNHILTKGDFRLCVKNPTQGESYYCLECAKDMVADSKSKLSFLESELNQLNSQ